MSAGEPLALESGIEESEKGGQRAQGSHPAQAVPAGAERGLDVCGGGIQPRDLGPVYAHLVPQGPRALGDTRFAAPDE